MFKSILDHRVTLAILMSLPAIAMLAGLANGTMSLEGALHPTGETAARLTIIALIISPLRTIWPRARLLYWFLRRRRDIGVAAFAYAAFHTVLYVIHEGSLAALLGDLGDSGIWTGWLAFLIFVPMAATSNDWAVRTLGRAWKGMQRWAYPAAVLTLAHWLLVSESLGGALVHFAPLAALQAWRIYRIWRPAEMRTA